LYVQIDNEEVSNHEKPARGAPQKENPPKSQSPRKILRTRRSRGTVATVTIVHSEELGMGSTFPGLYSKGRCGISFVGVELEDI